MKAFPGDLRGNRPIISAVAVVCLLLLALISVVQVTHLHQSASEADHCSLCLVLHSTAPIVVAAAAAMVLVQLGVSTPLLKTRVPLREKRKVWALSGALVVVLCLGAAGQSTREIPSEVSVPKQTGTPLPLKPDLPGLQRSHRLILKDGTYQLVREYFSQERADWEELPVDLVDWDATRKWENANNSTGDEVSPAMKEAEEIDKTETEARDNQRARTPEVVPGLELPDEDGVFVLDTFHGTPELVELPASDLSLNARDKHGIGTLNPLAGQTACRVGG